MFAWGITLLKDAPNRENAIKFLQLLLGPVGTACAEGQWSGADFPGAGELVRFPQPSSISTWARYHAEQMNSAGNINREFYPACAKLVKERDDDVRMRGFRQRHTVDAALAWLDAQLRPLVSEI
jgi:hypothetical protein